MPPALLIGFGNVLRGDDGVGYAVAERLAEEVDPGRARVVAAHQLLIEHVELLREAERVVFVDAAVDVPAGGIETARAEPADVATSTFHHLTPAALLAACVALHGRVPAATFVRIGVASVETSTALSPTLAARFDGYCEVVRDLLSA